MSLTYEQLKKPIKVRAISVGYYGHQVKNFGDVFECERQQFSKNWMVAIDEKGIELKEQPSVLKASEVNPVLEAHAKKEEEEKRAKAKEAAEALQKQKEEEEEAEARRIAERAAELLKQQSAGSDRVNPEGASNDGDVNSLI